MKSLFIANRLPPAAADRQFGSQQRFRLFTEAIARISDDLTFLAFVGRPFVENGGEREVQAKLAGTPAVRCTLAPMASRVETFTNHYLAAMFDARHGKLFAQFADDTAVTAVKTALAGNPDLIVVTALPLIIPVLAARPTAPILFDMDDLFHKVHWREALTKPFRPGKLGYLLQTPALIALERRAIRAATCTAVCTEQDRAVLARLGAGQRVAVIPNGVAAPCQPPPQSAAPNILFLGNYAYDPNAIAAERLLRRIWPAIHAARPDARLLLAGGSVSRLRNLPAGAEALGFVPDLAALYARTRIVCCPLDVGGGTRIKLIEAAAYGRAMVSTRIGAEGLDFRNGTEIILRDDDAGLAAACVALLDDPDRCTRLGTAARAKMQLLYEADLVRDRIAALATRLITD